MKKFLALTVMALYLSLLAAAAAADSGEYPRTITDSSGREVKVEMPIERIIVLTTESAEAVRILGDGDTIVGVTDLIIQQSDYFPELQDREVVGSWNEFDYEKIGRLATEGDRIVPDILVICYPSGSYNGASYAVDAVAAGLAPFQNIAVAAFDLNRPQTMARELADLGVLLGREAEASDFLRWNEEHLQAVKDAVSGRERPVVYAEREAGSGMGEISTYGRGSALHDLMEEAGGSNLVQEQASYPRVSWEWVVTREPDVIILTPRTVSPDWKGLGWDPSRDGEAIQEIINQVASRPGAEGVPAVEEGRVYVVYRDVLFGMDSVVGMTYLASVFYPDARLDPGAVYAEYLDRLGLSYPQGRIFVYPSPG
ncbi:MAG: ABC transporter substrate-binding protein [Methanosarcinales archaeon]|nr:ABC transporter substrate-binding protein [Methanosarcinales archaeon]